MRLVLDTNVLIAAFITRGTCSDVFEQCIRHHEAISSEFILGEFHDKMIQKFKYSPQEADAAILLLRSRLQVVAPVDLKAPVCRDPDDDLILATAIAGDAACIVTGDSDLLDIGRFHEIDILAPAEFAAYEAGSPQDL